VILVSVSIFFVPRNASAQDVPGWSGSISLTGARAAKGDLTNADRVVRLRQSRLIGP
jgi:hypothetical protein